MRQECHIEEVEVGKSSSVLDCGSLQRAKQAMTAVVVQTSKLMSAAQQSITQQQTAIMMTNDDDDNSNDGKQTEQQTELQCKNYNDEQSHHCWVISKFNFPMCITVIVVSWP
jgi:hypothetical protein